VPEAERSKCESRRTSSTRKPVSWKIGEGGKGEGGRRKVSWRNGLRRARRERKRSDGEGARKSIASDEMYRR